MNTPEAVTGCILSCVTGQKMKFSMKDFFSKCDRISGFLRIWSHLLKKSLMENFIFCAVKKEPLTQAIFCEFCEIFKSTLHFWYANLVLNTYIFWTT